MNPNSSSKIEAEERNDIAPLCPHCNASIRKVHYRGLQSIFGQRYLYFCAACDKVLGVSHRKGFWMG